MSVFPLGGNGGVEIRDAVGNCLNPPNITNAYCPPGTFTVGPCNVTALPDDCTARIMPSQINAIISELLCFAVSLDPDGAWNCDSMCNLSAAFQAWFSEHFFVDGITITGTGTLNDPWKAEPAAILEAICADAVMRQSLAQCVLSGDADNSITIGSDGRLYAPNYSDGITIDGNGSTGNRFRIIPLGVVNAICADGAARQALVDCVLSNDAGQMLVTGTDFGILLTPESAVAQICANAAASAALVDCVLSDDAGQNLTLGADGKIYYNLADVPLNANNCIRAFQYIGLTGAGILNRFSRDGELAFTLFGTNNGFMPQVLLDGPVTPETVWYESPVANLVNSNPCYEAYAWTRNDTRFNARRIGDGSVLVREYISIDGGPFVPTNTEPLSRFFSGTLDTNESVSAFSNFMLVIPAGATRTVQYRVTYEIVAPYGAGSAMDGTHNFDAIGGTALS